MRPRAWQSFSVNVKCVVAGAKIVSEILYSVLYDDTGLLRTILTENLDCKNTIIKFVRALLQLSDTMSGRIIIHRLLQEYQFESSWPTDDISMRRLYYAYVTGELARRLPEVEKRITAS